MKTIMSLEQLTTLDAIKQFLEGTQAVAFKVATDKPERYRWVQKTLVKHRHLQLGKTDRGTVTPPLPDEGNRLLSGPDQAPDTAIGKNRHNLSEASSP